MVRRPAPTTAAANGSRPWVEKRVGNGIPVLLVETTADDQITAPDVPSNRDYSRETASLRRTFTSGQQ
jgi:hypothetical protein